RISFVTKAQGPEQFLSLEASVEDESEEENDDSKEGTHRARTKIFCLLVFRTVALAERRNVLLRASYQRVSGIFPDNGLQKGAREVGPDTSERLFFAKDCCLWRVAIKPGYEETATFILMEKIIRSPSRDWGIKSIIGWVTYPGWVVVEAPNGTNVEELCEGVHN
ncbi:hypothetical protein DXG01_010870, partial [Tephrocybe rancida]